jgi:hypothetical protein
VIVGNYEHRLVAAVEASLRYLKIPQCMCMLPIASNISPLTRATRSPSEPHCGSRVTQNFAS